MVLTMRRPIGVSRSADVNVEAIKSWVHVIDRLPEDGELVHVIIARTREIRTASRGHYESTSAWFDAKTHEPIYETILHWKARS
jgi:hypothetical protein